MRRLRAYQIIVVALQPSTLSGLAARERGDECGEIWRAGPLEADGLVWEARGVRLPEPFLAPAIQDACGVCRRTASYGYRVIVAQQLPYIEHSEVEGRGVCCDGE